MLYINNSKLTDKLTAKGLSITFEDAKNIAYGLPTLATATTTELETILEVLLYTSLAAQRFVATVYETTSSPPNVKTSDIWFDKLHPTPVATRYINNYANNKSKIIIANLLSFLGKVPQFDRVDLQPIFPNNNGLFTSSVVMAGSNADIINTLMSLSSPEKPLIIGSISIAELYNVIIALLDIISPSNNYTAFQINILGIPLIRTKTEAITALQMLVQQEEGGVNKPFNATLSDYIMYYKLGELIYGKEYVLTGETTYDYVGPIVTISGFDKDQTLTLTSLSTHPTFLDYFANISALQAAIYSDIKNAYLHQNINFFYGALDMQDELYTLLEDLKNDTISYLTLTNHFFIPFYSFL